MKRNSDEVAELFAEAKASRWSSLPGGVTLPAGITPLPAVTSGTLSSSLGQVAQGPAAPLGSMMAPPMTVSAAGRYEQLVVFTREQIGCIIGKGGGVVKKIRESTGAWVTINKDDGSDTREVTVSGSSVEQMQLALGECIKAAGEAKQNATAPVGNDVVITVPQSMVGRVIGKGGDMIRKIQASSGATLKISNECAPGTTDRTVSFTGSEQAVTVALEMVTKIMADAPTSGAGGGGGAAGSLPSASSFAPPSYSTGIDPTTGYPAPPPGYILVPALPPPPGYTPPPGFLCVAAPQQQQVQYMSAPNPYAPQFAAQQYMGAPNPYGAAPMQFTIDGAQLPYPSADAPTPAPLLAPPPPDQPYLIEGIPPPPGQFY
eukprot:CAMPEP_0174695834 /NCGR_PEP_ID=MMETSP1094-20130205/2124_1 /TAXON_ID=156173 /ORGANISM="Chrysochromulina brevifilum, Strain UTEX LB 985" /LENGTH=373 /DNA_ID=CAMNT_0015892441 /DNA_START=85 /DNA_END=1206 /DNA_ORIENTATION=-